MKKATSGFFSFAGISAASVPRTVPIPSSGRVRLPRSALALVRLVLLLLCAVPLYAAEIGWNELYKSRSILGLVFSDKVGALDGQTVTMKGFMAPPLKAAGTFFVLTQDPVTLCPFCQSDADWPSDIVVVYLDTKQFFSPNNREIEVTGRLEVGSRVDAETGFVSRLRIVDAVYR